MKKQYLLLSGGICMLSALAAQQPDTAVQIHEVVVTGIRETVRKETSLDITSLPKKSMAETGSQNLCDALTKLPGVSALTSGLAIAKPVIRGMYGNRILVLLSSLKFDNQQWQDEHGMGLSDVGVDRVELIKGPASILYGSEAIGGVINVIEDEPSSGRKADLNLRLSSNTGGINADAGWSNASDKGWWRIRIGAENHADYSDGAGTRVLNSRFDGYFWKGTLGRQNARSKHVYNYNGSLNDFGFILPDLYSLLKPDARWSRSLSGPHHVVALNVFSAQNTYWREKGTLKFNIGLQSNLRLEDEGGGSISLNMHLLSVPYNLQWIRPLNTRTEFIVSNTGSFENNTNYGGRIIVPNANMFEEGVSAFIKHRAGAKTGTLITELGIGVNDKFIQTFLTRGLNTPDKAIHPFVINRTALNVLGGVTWNITGSWNIKANVSSGYRAPNLAELSSNGLHEGIFRYEIGRPDLHVEQNFNEELEASYTGRIVQVRAAYFLTQFQHYIYLTPTADTYFGFPIDRYQQSDAHLEGAEVSATLSPGAGLHYTQELSELSARKADGSYLPYIAPPKWVNRLRWEGKGSPKFHKPYFFVAGSYVFAQQHPAVYETYTPPYFLLDAGAGANLRLGRHPVTVRLIANNLLDRKYADHLSRFKNYGLNNIGRNIMLSVNYNFHA
jgi:iron complex outermembrane receptor protein